MDILSKTANMVVSPLKDISGSVNSTISNSAERTWQLMTGSGGGGSSVKQVVDEQPHDDNVTTVVLSENMDIVKTLSSNEGDPEVVDPPRIDTIPATPINEDDLNTPRPSNTSKAPDNDNDTHSTTSPIQVREDYFSKATYGQSSTLNAHKISEAGATNTSSGPVTPTMDRLQSKPTTALSLSQVHASSTVTSSSASVTLPYDEATSIRSLVPTIDSGNNDVAGMLGEILNEDIMASNSSYGPGWMLSNQMEDEEMEDDSEEEWDESENEDDLSEDERIVKFRSRRKHFFILSAAGKPVYSRYGDEGVVSQFMGVIQTIISFFQQGDDPLRSFSAGKHKFCILQEGHLYLVAISSLGETDAQLRTQLDMLYTQVLSTLTLTTVTKIFTERENTDLRRMLGGTEVFLNGLSDAMVRGEPNILLGSLECVKMRKHVRDKINNILLKCRTTNLLYGLIIADGRLASVIRPKRHSLHPPDLQLFISMLFNANTFKGGAEVWTPICLPKFNAKGFLHAYICFFRPEIALVLISPTREAFFEMQEAKDKIIDQLDKAGSISVIEGAVKRGRYLASDIIDGTVLQHFLYKSKANVQFTMPSFDPHYSTLHARRRLMILYQRLHAAVHARNAHLKVHHSIRRRSVSLAWVTPTFELYCVAGPGTPRNVLAQHANAVVGWVKREEERLFIVGGATF